MKQVLKKNIFIAGQTGSGKSFFVKHKLIPLFLKDDFRPLIILDMKNEYDNGLKVDINQVKNPFDYAKIFAGEYTKKAPKVLILKCMDYTTDDIERLLIYMNDSMNKILIWDESSFYFEDLKHKELPYEIKKFIRTKTLPHNANHNVIFITQSPQDIPKIVIGQCSKGYIFELMPFQLRYLYMNDFVPEKPENYTFPVGKHKYYEIR
jgi:hypothetical protein